MKTKPIKLKGYGCYDKQNPAVVKIFFAKTLEQAKVSAYQDLKAKSLTDIMARRETWADRFADAGTIPIQSYLLHGWSTKCAKCNRPINSEISVIVGDTAICKECENKLHE